MEKISILLADSQYLIREGLCSIIQKQDDFEVVAQAGSLQELMLAIERHQPDVVVIDHDSAEFYAESRIGNFGELADQVNLLVISQEHDKHRIRKILEHGVNSFLTKYCDEREIVQAIRACVRKDKFFCTKVLDILIDSNKNQAVETCAPSSLTSREVEIVRLIAKGLKTKEIAEDLNLSHHTINTHRKNILRKLNIRSGQELILYAISTGLIETSEISS